MLELEAHFKGRVQGVGFRAATCQVAREMNLVGYVSNLKDGRVLLVAQGSKEELAIFLSKIQKKFEREIIECDHTVRPLEKNLLSFRVE